MTKPKVKSEDLIAEVIKIAQANPEFVYDSTWGCSYARLTGEGGSCLFGKALSNLGVNEPTLKEIDAYEATEVTIGALSDPDSEYDYPIDIIGTSEQAAAMQKAQQAQDNSKPWGKAIEPLLDFLSSTV
ncbi:hypothetical protein SEA_WEASELS2_237 [Rhodococcus phage Weasels2]|uniref:Uncharacterized protein n=1 Tax=Rhodococcus phage Weasels2 TaxID=1897437 RepID=A0A1I9SAK9_9CAUD|nr:hypothetical protein FDH04_gp179 [Rhodococcus phage Weasels2]AOZ63815.1 hypothetical protein SEA_WEASELS2_237 [Rhodococcus phage Weasels2]